MPPSMFLLYLDFSLSKGTRLSIHLPSHITCSGKINDPNRYPSALFRGERIYFCTQACLRTFESDPERFMSREIEHPADEDE